MGTTCYTSKKSNVGRERIRCKFFDQFIDRHSDLNKIKFKSISHILQCSCRQVETEARTAIFGE